MTFRVQHAALVLMLAATPAAAQTAAPPVKPGETVTVTNLQGFEFRGDVTMASTTAVEVLTSAGPKRIAMADVSVISKKDSNANGFWIGFGLGAVVSASGIEKRYLGSGVALSLIVLGALSDGGVGWLIDNAIEGREVLYRRSESAAATAIHISPIVGLDGPKRVGVGGTISWR